MKVLLFLISNAMETLKTYKLDNEHRLRIAYCDWADSPRSRDNLGKICIQPHRRYSFPNELSFDFDAYYSEDDNSELEEIKKKYHVFHIDCYEHSSIHLSLSGEGMQCRFDTANDIGFIAVPMEYNGYDSREWSKSTNQDKGEKTSVESKQAYEIAKGELETYNSWLNGEVYSWIIEKSVKYTSEEGKEIIQWESEDGWMGDCYSEKDILDEVKGMEQFKGLDFEELD